MTHTTDTGPAGTFLDLAYTYDSASRVSTANATGTSAGSTETYGYDPASRLTAATVPAPTASSTTGTQAHSYAYDLAGDLTQIATPTLTQNLAYDAAQELTSITNPATGSATALSYNPEGDRLSQASASGSTTYTWNQANQLVGFAGAPVSAVNGQAGTDVQLSYSYNGDGLRSDLVYDQVEGLPLVSSPAPGPASSPARAAWWSSR